MTTNERSPEPQDGMLIGFDIGATKIRCCAFTLQRQPLAYDKTGYTPSDYNEFLDAIKQNVEDAET